MGAGVPEILVTDGRRAASVAARAWYGDPAAAHDADRHHRHQRQDDDHRAGAPPVQRARAPRGASARSAPSTGRGSRSRRRPAASPRRAPSICTRPSPSSRNRGVTHVAMETSSHSLDQGRLDGLTFAAGVFTNLTHEHLDYHRTMEDYLAAKLRLSALLGPAGLRDRQRRRPRVGRAAAVPTAGHLRRVARRDGARRGGPARGGREQLPPHGAIRERRGADPADGRRSTCPTRSRPPPPRWRSTCRSRTSSPAWPPRPRCRDGWSGWRTRRWWCSGTTPTRPTR